jgi:hypothetical protein
MDHRNLLFSRTPPSPKVLRWKLAIQEFNCTVHHIAGEDNMVADALSRLCAGGVTGSSLMVLLHQENDHQPLIPDDKLSTIASFHNATVGHFGIDRTIPKAAHERT